MSETHYGELGTEYVRMLEEAFFAARAARDECQSVRSGGAIYVSAPGRYAGFQRRLPYLHCHYGCARKNVRGCVLADTVDAVEKYHHEHQIEFNREDDCDDLCVKADCSHVAFTDDGGTYCLVKSLWMEECPRGLASQLRFDEQQKMWVSP